MYSQDYLQLMQVDVFKLRDKLSENEEEVNNVYLYTDAKELILFAEGKNEVDEAALLARITAALKRPLQGRFESELALAQFEFAPRVVIYLGDMPQRVQRHFQHAACFITHSLGAMLKDPSLKRSVWETLQAAMQEL